MSQQKSVYICFSTDIIHSGHLAILNKAAQLGELTVGVLSDQAVASFKRYPLLPFEERKNLFENINFHITVHQNYMQSNSAAGQMLHYLIYAAAG